MPELSADAPSLADAGSRLRPAWIAAWLLDPQSLCDRCDDAARASRSAGADQPSASGRHCRLSGDAGKTGDRHAAAPPDDERLADGEALYEDLGCIQCHRFTPPADADAFGRTSLFFVGRQISAGALEAYLAQPHANYAWSRMPDFHLSQSEVDALAEFIRSKCDGKNPEAAGPSSNATRGRELFQTAGCSQCHRRGRGSSSELRRVAPMFGSPTLRADAWPTIRPPAARPPIFA